MNYFYALVGLLMTHAAGAQTLLGGMPTPNGDIYAIEKVGNTVYMGGFFSQVNGVPRAGIASFNATTGALDPWAPTDITNGVTSITPVADKLVVGGSFTSVNGQSRLGICMFDLATGNLNAWSDNVNFLSWRQGVGTYNNTFYYGTLSPSRIVAVDALTGTSTSWQSSPGFQEQGDINTIYVSATHVYVGGIFHFATGPSVYSNLCRFDRITGALDSTWHPQPTIGNFGITSIVRTNNNLFVGGNFTMISGQARKGVAAYDLTGNLTTFDQNSSSSEVLSLYPDGDYIWVGGNSYLLGGQTRYRIAQIRISNSAATCWDASSTTNSWSTVQAIHVASDTVYAGPFATTNFAVFTGSPLPQTPVGGVAGLASVVAGQSTTYSVPYVAGYTYAWTITGGTGSSTSNSISVDWGAGPTGMVSVVVTHPGLPNCYGEAVTLQVAISIGMATHDPQAEPPQAFSLFPNPANELTTLRCPTYSSGARADVRVLDLLGNVVLSFTMKNAVSPLDLAALSKGVYFVLIETDGGSFGSRLVKQ